MPCWNRGVGGENALGFHGVHIVFGRGTGPSVQPAFEQRQKILSRHAFHPDGSLKVEPELALKHSVNAFDLLLLAELYSVADELGSADVAAVLAGWLRSALLDRATGFVAALALQKEFHSFPAA